MALDQSIRWWSKLDERPLAVSWRNQSWSCPTSKTMLLTSLTIAGGACPSRLGSRATASPMCLENIPQLSHALSYPHYDARCWLLDAHLLRTTTTLVRVGTIAPSLSVGAAHSLVGVPRTTCSSRSASLAERNPWPPQPAALYTKRP